MLKIFKKITIQHVTYIVTIVGVVIAVLNFYHIKKIESARLIIEFDNHFINNKKNFEIMDKIDERKYPILKLNGGTILSGDLERYLGEFELMNNFYDNRLISEEMLYDSYSYYIEEAYKNKEIIDYIKQIRLAEKSPDLYLGFEQLAKKFLATEKSH